MVAFGEVVKESFLFFPGPELVGALDDSLLRKPLSRDCFWREEVAAVPVRWSLFTAASAASRELL